MPRILLKCTLWHSHTNTEGEKKNGILEVTLVIVRE